MLDLDVVVGSREGVPGGRFKRPTARIVHFTDE